MLPRRVTHTVNAVFVSGLCHKTFIKKHASAPDNLFFLVFREQDAVLSKKEENTFTKVFLNLSKQHAGSLLLPVGGALALTYN